MFKQPTILQKKSQRYLYFEKRKSKQHFNSKKRTSKQPLDLKL